MEVTPLNRCLVTFELETERSLRYTGFMGFCAQGCDIWLRSLANDISIGSGGLV